MTKKILIANLVLLGFIHDTIEMTYLYKRGLITIYVYISSLRVTIQNTCVLSSQYTFKEDLIFINELITK